jgi:transposase
VWLDRTGAPWRDLPGQFGPWERVASRSYRWRRQGIWDRVLAALQANLATADLDTGGWSILTSRTNGIGRRWAPAAAATPPSGGW